MNEHGNISKAIREGSEDVFQAFFRAEFDNVAFFVNRYVHDAEQARDIAQESFITLWNKRMQIDPEYNLRTYVFSIARNRACNFLRDRSRRKIGSLDAREASLNLTALNSTYIEEQIDALQLERIIDNIYELLPAKYRDDFRLSRDEGLSYREIADRRGVTVKIVEYHIGLALKFFRERLKKRTD